MKQRHTAAARGQKVSKRHTEHRRCTQSQRNQKMRHSTVYPSEATERQLETCGPSLTTNIWHMVSSDRAGDDASEPLHGCTETPGGPEVSSC